MIKKKLTYQTPLLISVAPAIASCGTGSSAPGGIAACNSGAAVKGCHCATGNLAPSLSLACTAVGGTVTSDWNLCTDGASTVHSCNATGVGN